MRPAEYSLVDDLVMASGIKRVEDRMQDFCSLKFEECAQHFGQQMDENNSKCFSVLEHFTASMKQPIHKEHSGQATRNSNSDIINTSTLDDPSWQRPGPLAHNDFVGDLIMN